MQKKKNIVVLLIIITIIIIIATMITIAKMKKVNMKERENEEILNNEVELGDELGLERNNFKIQEEEYYNIARLVTIYYNQINKGRYIMGNGESFANDETVKKGMYNLLSTQYIENNQITIENLYNHIEDINEAVTFVPTDMDVEKSENTNKYLVTGNIVYMNSDKMVKTRLYVNWDINNETFSIEPQVKSSEINDILKSIEKNDDNHYNEEDYFDAEKMCKLKFNNFKLLALRKSEDLYNMLNEEYRNKKFGDYENFKKYVDDNYEMLSKAYLTRYKKEFTDEYNQFVCIDNNNKYYIFRSSNQNFADILLDTYTVDLPEFTEKYEKANDSTKVGYNVERFISAINDKDYKFAYNLLDEVYKRNNMDTLEKFENYVKNNLYENNELQYQSVEKSGNNYIYELSVTDANDEKSSEKSITIIMKLLSGTDFVMSFSMDK